MRYSLINKGRPVRPFKQTPEVAAAAVGGAMNLIGSMISSGSAPDYREQIEAQTKAQKELFDYQYEKNSIGAMLKQYHENGVNPGSFLSDGQMQNQSMPSSVNADPNTGIASKLMFAQLANMAAQTAKTYAETENIKQNTEKQAAETEQVLTDNEFREMLNTRNLDLLSAQYQETLSKKDLNLEQIKNLHQQYELLVAQVDEVYANIDVLRANANKIDKETALVELDMAIKQMLADNEIRLTDAQIRNLSAQAYMFVQNGDRAAAEKAIFDIQKDVEEQTKDARVTTIKYEGQFANYKARLEKQKMHAQELQNERTKAGQGFAASKPVSICREYFGVIGSVFGGASNVAAAAVK